MFPLWYIQSFARTSSHTQVSSSMKVIDVSRDEESLNKVFEKLYVPTFSRFKNEYTDPEFYRSPVDDANPQSYVLSCNPDDPVGFLIFEIYKRSNCALLTYVAVRSDCRGQGIFKLMFEEADKIFRSKDVKAVYAEIHNPQLEVSKNDLMNSNERLQVFQKMGAEILPIKYVQPPLDEESGPSKDLLLLTFNPAQGMNHARSFLHEFYQCLNVADPDNDENFLSMFER